MFFAHLLIAILVALLGPIVLLPIISGRPKRNGDSVATSVLFFFLILFFATWAGGVWIRPFGPSMWGAYWLPFVLVGVFVAMLLAAATEPARRDRARQHIEAPTETPVGTAVAMTAFGMFFWSLIIGLLVAVIARYTVG